MQFITHAVVAVIVWLIDGFSGWCIITLRSFCSCRMTMSPAQLQGMLRAQNKYLPIDKNRHMMAVHCTYGVVASDVQNTCL